MTTAEPAPVMLKVAGKRFACERCGATVFTPAGENFACNGYGGVTMTETVLRAREAT